jgi:hypothetical protein
LGFGLARAIVNAFPNGGKKEKGTKEKTMKKNMNRTLMLTAAALTIGAAAIYGQGNIVANIPFAFHAAGGAHAAGTYNVLSISQNNGVLALRNAETGKAVILGIGVPEGGSRYGDSRARLVFRCGDESGCALSQVWASSSQGWSFAAPRLKPSELEHVAVVYPAVK